MLKKFFVGAGCGVWGVGRREQGVGSREKQFIT
jgi:hypothetical protein